MAVTYDPAWPTDKDWVRWRLGDTSTSDGILQDAEITSALGEYGSKQEAAWRSAQAIYAEFARLAVDSKMGQLQFLYSKRAEWYKQLITELEVEAKTGASVAAWFGATSRTDKQTQEENDDRVSPSFARDQFSPEGFALNADTGLSTG